MESYGFFNGDTEYGQDEFNRYFNNLYENGISIDDTGKMTLSAAISGSSLKVSAGFAIITMRLRLCPSPEMQTILKLTGWYCSWTM